MKSHRSVLAIAVLASMFASDALAGGRKPGSVLIYPVHRSGPRHFTVVCVTNSNLQPSTPVSIGGSTNVHFEYANVVPSNMRFMPKDCIIFDRVEYLTPADTLCVLTACHNATSFEGNEGYLVITAEDPTKFQTAWSHNWLMGSELVTNASGISYSVNAIPFESPIPAGQPTDVSPANGQRDFNGQEYEAIPDVLYIDSFVALAESQLALLNLTGGPLDKNTVLLSVWNDNEFALSATLSFNCWFDEPLTYVSPLFSDSFLRTVPNNPRELDVTCNGRDDLETGWARIQSIGVKTPGGTSVANDGALLGCITAGLTSTISGGRLLWESVATQNNGSFFNR
jgi:hypothetical protein